MDITQEDRYTGTGANPTRVNRSLRSPNRCTNYKQTKAILISGLPRKELKSTHYYTIYVAISYNIVRTCPTYLVVTRSQKLRLLVSVVRERLTFKPIQNRTISSVAHKTVTASSSTIVTKFSAKKGAVNLPYNTNKACPLHACTISVTAPFLVPRPLLLQPKHFRFVTVAARLASEVTSYSSASIRRWASSFFSSVEAYPGPPENMDMEFVKQELSSDRGHGAGNVDHIIHDESFQFEGEGT